MNSAVRHGLLLAKHGCTVALLLSTGCALTEKGKALDVRWFAPERVGNSQPCLQAAQGHSLRIDTVKAGTGLEERILHGDGAYQLAYYDSRRWLERPERYVMLALEHTLFEECGFQRMVDGDAPALSIEVLDFQEVLTTEKHEARIALRTILANGQVVTQDTLVLTEPVTGLQFDDFVAAMSTALEKIARQVANRTGAVLAQQPAAPKH